MCVVVDYNITHLSLERYKKSEKKNLHWLKKNTTTSKRELNTLCRRWAQWLEEPEYLMWKWVAQDREKNQVFSDAFQVEKKRKENGL